MCRIVLTACFFLVTRLTLRVRVTGAANISQAPSTYFAIMHKRDSDPPIVLPTILFRRGRHALAGEVHFGLRGDAFAPGFLARMVGRPYWFAWLLRPINVGPLLRSLGVEPLLGLNVRPAEDWIRATVQEVGDIPVAEALAPEFIHAIAQRSKEPAAKLGRKPLSHLLHWRYYPWLQRYVGPSLFADPLRRRMERYAIDTVKGQLADLAAWLRQGGAVMGAPEGMLSTDGRVSRISGGFQRILREAPAATAIIPIVFIYDFMRKGRPRVFITIAPAIANAAELSINERDRRLRDTWLAHAYFTCTQLGSEILIQHSQSATPTFTTDEFIDAVEALALRLAEVGRFVDPELLAPILCAWHVENFLAYAAHHGAIRKMGEDAWEALPQNTNVSATPGEVGYQQQPFGYAWREFHDMLNGDERVLQAPPLSTAHQQTCRP
jgi:hypothetical protein